MVPAVSFEFFPPKTAEAATRLQGCVALLQRFRPGFVSVTYGAGGSTRDTSLNLAEMLAAKYSGEATPVAMHFTCLGSTREEVRVMADRLWDRNIRHIVALRGDPPKSVAGYARKSGYRYASELVAALRKQHPFDISVAGYPEVHPEASSAAADMDALKAKVDAGAARVLTQFFFNNDDFLRYRDAAVKAGIKVPIVPGMLPVYSFVQAKRFAGMCGASIPEGVSQLLESADGHDWQPHLAAGLLQRQCLALQGEGVTAFHFYTLNRPEAVAAACHTLGLRLQ